MDAPAITDQEFSLFQRLVHQIAGIKLADNKKALLVGRLQKRLREHQLGSFGDYYRMVSSGRQPAELQTMVDLLTTNETYFFREARHLEFLRDEILGQRPTGGTLRLWSAASSSGEEAYSLAMVIADTVPGNARWEVFGSDISTQVLAKARAGRYPLERNEGIPEACRRKYCVKTSDDPHGFLVAPAIRQHVRFAQVNLTRPIDPRLGLFDVIFLRNVMIYFDSETKRQVIANLLPQLLPGGYLIVGHSESLNGITDRLKSVKPTIYRKP
ncbi:protein-glutamate O-methyltransferase CheR [Accumulibacter sp.]|uniref:CheR family methyltransferase n=1 Tax=Accumulibacter sp. TaxID=2053492 RepID=UPI0026135244|nr:protein-glutamate O-methyltransferase CheR [Accumulibacter sp.]